ncbi:MAG: LysM peptidoglycan-binding domain-containing protein [Bacteroidales bacterium]|nr:LysM peptidoglycan-binding domain-containing protein [Bacteroidales bacterium]
MKRFLFFSLLLLTCSYAVAQDLIILRSGEECEGKVTQASQNAVVVESKKGGLFSKEAKQATLAPSDVYMIKYKERGNIYFKEDGKRVSGENQKLDKSADIIYLKEGKEIPAWDLTFDAETISFRTSKESKKAKSATVTVATPEVFMIKYSDGSKDVINDMSAPTPPTADASLRNVSTDPRFKVIFHTVKAGDTLSSIASQYNVKIEDLRDWNDVESHIRSNSRLKVGQEYMIQQPIE